jgi:hypothetical protein
MGTGLVLVVGNGGKGIGTVRRDSRPVFQFTVQRHFAIGVRILEPRWCRCKFVSRTPTIRRSHKRCTGRQRTPDLVRDRQRSCRAGGPGLT